MTITKYLGVCPACGSREVEVDGTGYTHGELVQCVNCDTTGTLTQPDMTTLSIVWDEPDNCEQ